LKITDYDGRSDNELISRIREGEKQLVDILMDRYKEMVKIKANSMYILGAEQQDLIQEGMVGLFKAMQDYDIGRDASFSTFAQLCVNRQLYKAVTASQRQKHLPLNTYISFFGNDNDKEDDDANLIDKLPSTQNTNPEEMIIDRENVEILEKRIEEVLSDKEKQVLDLAITGMGYVEIAKVLELEEKASDNALQRARGKIRKLIF